MWNFFIEFFIKRKFSCVFVRRKHRIKTLRTVKILFLHNETFSQENVRKMEEEEKIRFDGNKLFMTFLGRSDEFSELSSIPTLFDTQ